MQQNANSSNREISYECKYDEGTDAHVTVGSKNPTLQRCRKLVTIVGYEILYVRSFMMILAPGM